MAFPHPFGIGGGAYDPDEAIRTCIGVMTPYGTAFAWDRFRTGIPSSRSITGHKETMRMQNVKMLHLAIKGGAAIERIAHTLENEAPLLICVWRSRYEELRHDPTYQRHDFVVIADMGNDDDSLHTHAFKGLADEEMAVTPDEEVKYSISGVFGYMSPQDEAQYAEHQRQMEEWQLMYGGGNGGGK